MLFISLMTDLRLCIAWVDGLQTSVKERRDIEINIFKIRYSIIKHIVYIEKLCY